MNKELPMTKATDLDTLADDLLQVRTEVGERWKDIRVTAHWSTEPTEASR